MAQRDAELTAVLAEFPTLPALKRAEPLLGHGGLSGARLWRVETRQAAFALRQWPVEHPSPERLRFIHAVLSHAFRCGITVIPVPIVARSGETFVTRHGRLWELAPWLPGEASFEREPTVTKVANAMRVLAQFHVACTDFKLGGWGRSEAKPPAAARRAPAQHSLSQNIGPSPSLLERFRRLNELDTAQLATIRRGIEKKTICPTIDDLARAILANLLPAASAARPLLAAAADMQSPLQPCLRDIWHANVLFTGDQVTGIVDFGAIQIDSPALDVARLLGSMAGDDPGKWRAGLAAYEEAGRPLSLDEHVAIRAADASGTVLGCVNWLHWLYLENRQFADLSAVGLRMKSLAVRLRHLAGAAMAS